MLTVHKMAKQPFPTNQKREKHQLAKHLFDSKQQKMREFCKRRILQEGITSQWQSHTQNLGIS